MGTKVLFTPSKQVESNWLGNRIEVPIVKVERQEMLSRGRLPQGKSILVRARTMANMYAGALNRC